jgi:hypothetical protein
MAYSLLGPYPGGKSGFWGGGGLKEKVVPDKVGNNMYWQ